MQRVREALSPVILDKNGVFKYIQIRVTPKTGADGEAFTVIRGYADCAFHADILNKF
jgi:Janus/Ocnus family (Ocnus)